MFCLIGRWNSKVSEQYIYYLCLQDSGNYEDVIEVILINKQGKGVCVIVIDWLFLFLVLYYIVDDIYKIIYDCDLKL